MTMIQSLNLNFKGSRVIIVQHFKGNNPIGSDLIQRIFTNVKGIFKLFRHKAILRYQ